MRRRHPRNSAIRLENVRRSRSRLLDGGESSPGRVFQEDDSGEDIEGDNDEMDVAGADLTRDTEHSLWIRLRDLKALRRGLSGPTKGCDAARRGLDGAITSLEEALSIMGDRS